MYVSMDRIIEVVSLAMVLVAPLSGPSVLGLYQAQHSKTSTVLNRHSYQPAEGAPVRWVVLVSVAESRCEADSLTETLVSA